MKCLWCGFDTTIDEKLQTDAVRYANKEHIFPKAVEGKKTLKQGKVCADCNKRLGDSVDIHLRQGNLAMIRQYQESSIIKGKPVGRIRSSNDRAEKEAAVKFLTDRSKSQKSIGREENMTNYTNYLRVDGRPIDLDFDEKFSKALLKCAINVLYEQKSQEDMRNMYPQALDFVNQSIYEGSRDWPYAACYSAVNYWQSFEPEALVIAGMGRENAPAALALLFPCAVFLVGMYPTILDWKLVQNFRQYLEKEDFKILEGFKNSTGDLSFYYLKKHIQGAPDPAGLFHILTRCRTCQQIGPTGFGIGRSLFLEPAGGAFPRAEHSWNTYTKSDLITMGINVSGMSPEQIDSFIGGCGVRMVDKLKSLINISDFRRECINCGEEIVVNGKDCFL